MCLNVAARQSGFGGPECVWMQQHGSQCLGARLCLNAAARQSVFGSQDVFECSSRAVRVWGSGCV